GDCRAGTFPGSAHGRAAPVGGSRPPLPAEHGAGAVRHRLRGSPLRGPAGGDDGAGRRAGDRGRELRHPRAAGRWGCSAGGPSWLARRSGTPAFARTGRPGASHDLVRPGPGNAAPPKLLAFYTGNSWCALRIIPMSLTLTLRSAITDAKTIAKDLLESGKWPRRPQQLVFEITGACDAKCIHCPRQEMDRPKRQMKMDLFRRMVDQAAEMRIPDLVPNGYGELLLINNLG